MTSRRTDGGKNRASGGKTDRGNHGGIVGLVVEVEHARPVHSVLAGEEFPRVVKEHVNVVRVSGVDVKRNLVMKKRVPIWSQFFSLYSFFKKAPSFEAREAHRY